MLCILQDTKVAEQMGVESCAFLNEQDYMADL